MEAFKSDLCAGAAQGASRVSPHGENWPVSVSMRRYQLTLSLRQRTRGRVRPHRIVPRRSGGDVRSVAT